MKISIVSPSNRINGLDIVGKCLEKQTFRDFEWLKIHKEPEKKEGDFYNLNKVWNQLFNKAQGELIVSIVDYTEFEPDTLSKLWEHYINSPLSCISGIGVQYKDGKVNWTDPRVSNQGIHMISPVDMEFRLCSVPRRAIQAVGGVDEEYDKVVAVSEKEMCLRIGYLGYKFYIDQSIVYKFYTHEDHGKEWDILYKKSVEMLGKHTYEILGGRRLQLPYVTK